MKISFNKKEIVDVLSKIQGITGRKTSLTITSDILIKAVGSSITITANDMETAFYGTYGAEVDREGILSINSKKFYEILREYPDHENFPETPVIEDVEFIEIKSKDLKKMVEMSSVIGYSGDEKRIYVIGSLIEKIINDGSERLRIVSTDSKRLHCYDAEFKGNLNLPEESIIVPKKGLSELNKFIDGNKESFNVGIKDNHFIFQDENESVMIKLLEGEYPDYKPVINYQDMIPVEVDRMMFSTLMKRISILTSDDYKSVILNFKSNELMVTITNPEIGESKERIMIPFSADEIKSAFNPRYFMDALGLFEDSIVVLNLKESKSPCIIKSLDNDRLICVIMAMHIS